MVAMIVPSKDTERTCSLTSILAVTYSYMARLGTGNFSPKTSKRQSERMNRINRYVP